MTRHPPLTEHELNRVADSLNAAGYWFPPDAIRAVDEGRDQYHPLAGPGISYSTWRVEVPIRAALERTNRGRHEDPKVTTLKRTGDFPRRR